MSYPPCCDDCWPFGGTPLRFATPRSSSRSYWGLRGQWWWEPTTVKPWETPMLKFTVKWQAGKMPRFHIEICWKLLKCNEIYNLHPNSKFIKHPGMSTVHPVSAAYSLRSRLIKSLSSWCSDNATAFGQVSMVFKATLRLVVSLARKTCRLFEAELRLMVQKSGEHQLIW